MAVTVVRVGNVRVVMRKRCVAMNVRVRFFDASPGRVIMLVVRVVNVGVLVRETGVHVLVRVPLAKQPPDPHDHQCGWADPSRSPRSGTATSAPKNGAVAKYPASRAAPTNRSA